MALFSLVARRKKGKANPYLLMLLMLVVLPLSVGMACTLFEAPVQTQTPVRLSTATPIAGAGTDTGSGTSTSIPPTDPLTGPDCCATETPSPTPGFENNVIIFSSGWSEAQIDIAMEAILAVGTELSRFLGGIASTSAFLEAYNVSSSTPFTFLKMEDAGSGCATGQRLIKCNPNYNISDPRLIVHELGHALQHSRYTDNSTGPYGDLKKPENAIIDDRGVWVTGQHPEPPQSDGKFERTFLGYKSNQIPDVYHGVEYDDWNSPNEDFADMFMNWVYISFDYDLDAYNAGTKRYDWIDDRIAGWIT